MNNKLRLILVEDEPAILRGLVLAITQISEDYEIMGTACSGEAALEQIQSLKPDIVITDIRMPVMSGLDLIESARIKSPDTIYIILTGYADFEYAKRAMKLNVTDYLLKPVDPDELESLLKKLEKDNRKKNRDGQLRYISQHLHSDSRQTEPPDILDGLTFYLMFVFFGSVTTNLYNEMSIGSQVAQDGSYEKLRVITAGCGGELYILRGNYFNERVFVFFTRCQSDLPDIPNLVKDRIYPGIKSEEIFTNCFLSEKIEDGQNLSEQIRSCYLDAASHALFGHDKLYLHRPPTHDDTSICVTPDIEEQLLLLKPAMDFSAMEALCRSFIEVWNSRGTSQFQIQTDLRCIFHAMTQKTGQLRRVYPNPSELLCAASSYEDLLQNMLLEFRRIYEAINTFPTQPKPTRQLAYKVREYLDQNYTHPVTYKDFNDIFGYNEKYISLIFKEAFDISPSKYIVELRLTAAKNMMKQNPEMLLKDIALAVGYDDQLYFSRVFKNSEGISPKAYQRQTD